MGCVAVAAGEEVDNAAEAEAGVVGIAVVVAPDVAAVVDIPDERSFYSSPTARLAELVVIEVVVVASVHS